MPTTVPRRVLRPLRTFLATESAGGVVLAVAAVVALAWANSPWSAGYHDLWHTGFGLRLGRHRLDLDLREWVSDGLMTIFFLVAGLEIKREVVHGELRDRRQAALPVVAAIGGMIVPALLYLTVNVGRSGAGWAVPMATDIAMVTGVLALIRRRIHPMLPLLMLAVAIVDDIGSIVVLTVGLGGRLAVGWLGLAALAVVAAIGLVRTGMRSTAPFVALGVVCWYGLHRGGVPPTLAGVAFGLLAPTVPLIDEVDQAELVDVSTPSAARRSVQIAVHAVSTVERLELVIHPWTSFLIVPVFALANAGIPLGGDSLSRTAGSPVFWGVVIARVIGKPLGIVGAVIIARRLHLVRLPDGITGRDITGIGLLAGMGFAVAIFIAGRSLPAAGAEIATTGVLVSMLVSGALGIAVLTRRSSPEAPGPVSPSAR